MKWARVQLSRIRDFLANLGAVVVVCWAIMLSACQSTPASKVEVYAPSVPAELRRCAGAPARPTGNYTQKDVAGFVTKLGGAYRDCKDKLGDVDALLTDYDQRAKASKK